MAKIMLDTPAEKTADTPATVPAPEPVAAQSATAEPPSALANGLPAAWSIEPPTVVVRRKARLL